MSSGFNNKNSTSGEPDANKQGYRLQVTTRSHLAIYIDSILKHDLVHNTMTYSPPPPATVKTVCVPERDNVLVPCPDLTAEDIKYNVYRDNEVVYTYEYNHKNNESTSVRVGMEPYKNAKDIPVGFMLTRVNTSSLGIYRCEGIVKYPPPLLQLQSQQWILVLIAGKYSYHWDSIYNLVYIKSNPMLHVFS